MTLNKLLTISIKLQGVCRPACVLETWHMNDSSNHGVQLRKAVFGLKCTPGERQGKIGDLGMDSLFLVLLTYYT